MNLLHKIIISTILLVVTSTGIKLKMSSTTGAISLNPDGTIKIGADPTAGYVTFNPNTNSVDVNGAGSQGVLGASTTNTPSQNTATTPALDPATQALLGNYDQSIGNTQSAINRLPGQQASALQGLDVQTQNALAQLLGSRNTSQQAYDTNKQQSATGYVGAKNSIGVNAGNALSGLLRLLGSRGAGGGSAATGTGAGTVRGEVGRNATLQRQDAGTTFGNNNQALDTNWANYLQGYNNSVSGVNDQNTQSKKSLQDSIDSNKASLLQSLATLTNQRSAAAGGNGSAVSQPYLDKANALLDKTANYTTAPINYQTTAYNAPSVASYTAGEAPTVSSKSQNGSDYFSPYLQALLGKKLQTA